MRKTSSLVARSMCGYYFKALFCLNNTFLIIKFGKVNSKDVSSFKNLVNKVRFLTH